MALSDDDVTSALDWLGGKQRVRADQHPHRHARLVGSTRKRLTMRWNCIACEWFGGGAYQGFGTTQALAVGGALGTENLIHAQIDQAASTIWAGQLRAPVQ